MEFYLTSLSLMPPLYTRKLKMKQVYLTLG